MVQKQRCQCLGDVYEVSIDLGMLYMCVKPGHARWHAASAAAGAEAAARGHTHTSCEGAASQSLSPEQTRSAKPHTTNNVFCVNVCLLTESTQQQQQHSTHASSSSYSTGPAPIRPHLMSPAACCTICNNNSATLLVELLFQLSRPQ